MNEIYPKKDLSYDYILPKTKRLSIKNYITLSSINGLLRADIPHYHYPFIYIIFSQTSVVPMWHGTTAKITF